LKAQFRNPVPEFKLQYCDDEGDVVRVTSQNEWDEMVRNGSNVLFISSPSSRIDFKPNLNFSKPGSSMRLEGMQFGLLH
jgi:hypothetical protein